MINLLKKNLALSTTITPHRKRLTRTSMTTLYQERAAERAQKRAEKHAYNVHYESTPSSDTTSLSDIEDSPQRLALRQHRFEAKLKKAEAEIDFNANLKKLSKAPWQF